MSQQRPALATFPGEILLPALTFLFGLQTVRVLVPGLTWTLGDRFSLGAFPLGGLALLIFGASFGAGFISRAIDYRRALFIAAGGLGLCRLLLQPWWGEPLLNLVLATAGTALFGIFTGLFLKRCIETGKGSHFAVSLLFGLLLDTAIFGAFGSYDTAWLTGVWPVALTALLVAGQWWLLLRTPASDANPDSKGPPDSFALLAIGPFLFLELVVFQNLPRLAALTGWSTPAAFGWLLLSQLLGLAAAVWAMGPLRERIFLAITAGLVLITTVTTPVSEANLVIGQMALGLLLAILLTSPSRSTGRNHVIAASGAGMLLLVVLILAYYAIYELKLPYSNTVVIGLAAFLVAGCAIIAAISRPTMARARLWLAPTLGTILLVLPLIGLAGWQAPQTAAGAGFPVRLMTYNLHSGFNPYGRLDLEAMAETIEAQHPDILALQEVSRGWLVNGRVDMLAWLSQRLGLPYIFDPTAGPLWGNAVLSRFPVLRYQEYPLPPADLPVERGFVQVVFDIGDGQTLNVIATHYHHIDADSAIRVLQSQAIVTFWNGQGRTVFLGDLNAEPDTPEIAILRNAGLVDSLAGQQDAGSYTFISTHPYQRIDYIWVSPDLVATDAYVVASTASDHRPVVATVSSR